MNFFEEYRSIKDQIAQLELQRLKLELLILDDLDNYPQRTLSTKWGVFSSSGRKTWQYPQSVKDIQEELKKKKKISELDGSAILVKDSQHVVLSMLKEGVK